MKVLLDDVKRVARDAMAHARSQILTATETKAHQDFVTNIDQSTDAFLERELGGLLPNTPVLSEERAVAQQGRVERYWIVDPIDGTSNLISGLPFYGVAICLVDETGPVLAVVGAVAQDDIYAAVRGQGATKNEASLSLSASPSSLIVLSTGLLDQLVLHAPAAYQALRRLGKIRNFGSQALHIARVAEGSFAAVASIEAKIWDEAAAGLILREAGGVWRSNADTADWTMPANLMAQDSQNSIACHPDIADAVDDALADVFNQK